jgi:Mrp family chromosome partitioning ATPase
LARANSDHIRVSQQLETLKTSEAALSLQIAKQGQDLIWLQQLNREAHATRVLYEHFLSRFKETASQQGIQKADSRILSPAVIPYKPSEPRKSLILSMAAIFGLAASTCLVLLGEVRRTTFRSLTALERFVGHVGLARLPALPANREHDFLEEMIANPHDWFPSAIRGLRTSLILNPSETIKTIAVTSSVEGEDCAATSLALAYDFTRLDRKVLLIDTCQTGAGLSDYFGDEPTRGIISVLRGNHGVDQALHHPDILGADVLFSDDTSISASDLFLSAKFESFMREMTGRYDVVILNAPAITTAHSTLAVLRLADTVLFNAKWDHTTKRQINGALRMLDHTKIAISGVILAGTETPIIQPQKKISKWIYSGLVPKDQHAAL